MIGKCERCKKEAHKREPCNYCGRELCTSCTKSSRLSRKQKKGVRLIICKDCWGKTANRTKYKSE